MTLSRPRQTHKPLDYATFTIVFTKTCWKVKLLPSVKVWNKYSVEYVKMYNMYYFDKTKCMRPITSFAAHCWLFFTIRLLLRLTTGKNERVFLTCPCHKIYRDEAVGLKSCKYTWKITIFVKMGNWGNIKKIWYFVNNCFNWSSNLKIFCTCVTRVIVIIWSTAYFVSTFRFSVKYRFPFPVLRFFTVKYSSVTQRSVSQENAYKKS